jgi:hypothetical protein
VTGCNKGCGVELMACAFWQLPYFKELARAGGTLARAPRSRRFGSFVDTAEKLTHDCYVRPANDKIRVSVDLVC